MEAKGTVIECQDGESATFYDPLTEEQRQVDMGDNAEIIRLLNNRLSKGLREYGHGVRVGDNTREWGCTDWEEMALEEVLDGLIYTAAAILKLRRRRTR